MAGQGGYQPPAKPAPVSGPGALSQRTDGAPGQPMRSMPAASYGDRKDMNEIQSGATMAGSEGVPSGPPVGQAPPRPMPLALDAPTQRPEEPITAGVASGPGPGPAPQSPQGIQDARNLLQFLPMMEERANQADASQSLRTIVQYLKGLS